MYTLMRAVVTFLVRRFFASITVHGDPRESGPLLIIGNHPNLALDSLVITTAYRRPLWYLAKATLFRNPIAGALLRGLHVIPIHRKQDDPAMMGRNAESFREVGRVLGAERAVLIFPEGMSVSERSLKPLKTGAARMALAAESERDWKLGLRLQAAGITYSSLTLFRSRAAVVMSEAIAVADLRDEYARDPAAAARLLTERAASLLSGVVVSVAAREHEPLVEKIATLYRASGSSLDDYRRFSVIARNVEMIAPENPALRMDMERRIDAHLDRCRTLGVPLGTPLDAGARWGVLRIAMTGLVVSAGWLIHVLPYKVTGTLVGKAAKDPVYEASFKLGLGTVLFCVWYLILWIAMLLVTGSAAASAGLLAAIVLCGAAALRYSGPLLVRLSEISRGSAPVLSELRAEREDLVEQLESLRVE